MNRAADVISLIATRGILIYGTVLVLGGSMTLGTMLYVHGAACSLFMPVVVLTQMTVQVSVLLVVLQRLAYTLDMRKEVAEDPHAVDFPAPLQTGISLRNVTFSWTSEKAPVIDNLNLDIPAGSWVCIMGASGCGKTTLLQLIARLYDPQEGELSVDGISMEHIRFSSLRRKMAYVPQEAQILSGTVRDNITYGKPDATPSEIMAAARAADAHDFIMELPVKYENPAGREGHLALRRQRQRLSIARRPAHRSRGAAPRRLHLGAGCQYRTPPAGDLRADPQGQDRRHRLATRLDGHALRPDRGALRRTHPRTRQPRPSDGCRRLLCRPLCQADEPEDTDTDMNLDPGTISRQTAIRILVRWIELRDFPDRLLPDTAQDRGFVMDLVFGTVRGWRRLEWVLAQFVKRRPAPLPRAALLLGVQQILFMPDVADHAAVHATVEAAKQNPAGEPGFVNAVLRNVLRSRETLLAELARQPLRGTRIAPDALVTRWIERMGADTVEALCVWNNAPAETVVAVLPHRGTTPTALLEQWEAAGVRAQLHPSHEACLVVGHGARVEALPGYAEGLFVPQDPSTLAAVDLLQPRPGERVLDACAPPAAKTARKRRRHAGQGTLVALERHAEPPVPPQRESRAPRAGHMGSGAAGRCR